MKKIILSAVAVIVVLVCAVTSFAVTNLNFGNVENIILTQNPDALITEIELENNGLTPLYEVTYYLQSVKYKATVNAIEGTILSETVSGEKKIKNNTAPVIDASMLITAEEAKSIALSHSALTADQAVFTGTELKNKKSSSKYKVSFIANGLKYKYSIDAVSGQVLEYKVK